MIFETEKRRSALSANALRRPIGCCRNPGFEPRLQYFLNQRRWADAMILPRKIIIPPAPACLVFAERRVLSSQAEIADRDDVLCGSSGPVTIGESVELFDITERDPGLPLDPGAQPRL